MTFQTNESKEKGSSRRKILTRNANVDEAMQGKVFNQINELVQKDNTEKCRPVKSKPDYITL